MQLSCAFKKNMMYKMSTVSYKRFQ